MIKKRKISSSLAVGLAAWLVLFFSGTVTCQATEKKNIPPTTADHTRFKALKKTFTNGQEVTRACLGCHTEAAKQVHDSIHWTWDWEDNLGKKQALNNF